MTWAFEFEDQPYFAGFRVLSTNGIRTAGAERLPHVRPDGRAAAGRREHGRGRIGADPQAGVRSKPDVSALASLRNGRVCVLVWHHHDDDVPGPAAEVELNCHLTGTQPLLMQHFRIDRDHSNAFEAWKRLGSPAQPTPAQYDELERSSQLALLGSPEWVRPETAS